MTRREVFCNHGHPGYDANREPECPYCVDERLALGIRAGYDADPVAFWNKYIAGHVPEASGR